MCGNTGIVSVYCHVDGEARVSSKYVSVYLVNYLAFRICVLHFSLLSTRGSCAQVGLNVLLSDTFAEPDTDCQLALAISNSSKSPILLFENMHIVKGIFFSLT